MFEPLISEAPQRFNLGGNAARLVRMVLDAIFDNGGFSALQRRFGEAGLEPTYRSWIGTTPGDNVLQPDEFSRGFGQAHSDRIASALNVPVATVNLAGAWLLPKLIGLLSRNGSLPDTRPADYERWFAAPVATPAPAHAAAAPRPVETRPTDDKGWMKWLIPLALLIGALLLYRSCQRQAPAPARDTTPVPAAAQGAKQSPVYDFANTAGKVVVSGRVDNEVTRARLWDALVAAFGAGNVSGKIDVNPDTLDARWANCVADATGSLKQPGLRFNLTGYRLKVDSTSLAADERVGASRTLRQCFGGYETEGLWDRAAQALSGLKKPYDARELMGALNLMEIYFDTDSAAITKDSNETLQRAAEAIKTLSPGTRIEVGGHTDNTGDAAHNLTLSQQRADAVVARLAELGVDRAMLSAKGYGQDKPKAGNDSEEGRAQNRRIEFNVNR